MAEITRRVPSPKFWEGRDVLVTGHTGFKGAWLSFWLAGMGARVHGFALDPLSAPSLYEISGLQNVMANDCRQDVRDYPGVLRVLTEVQPSVVMHLAAQPLVRDGYRRPHETIQTNLSGTLNVLEACHEIACVDAILVVTTDKVYKPVGIYDGEVGEPHSEFDALAGSDPYSTSKVMVEHLVDTYRKLPEIDDRRAWSIPVATARAGNVIGGGDWSHERLLPDCVRRFSERQAVHLRYPDATRPWQHVLEPLCGYMLLAEDLVDGSRTAQQAFNFGPSEGDSLTVRDVAGIAAEAWGMTHGVLSAQESEVPEHTELTIGSDLATQLLNWSPRWTSVEAVKRAVDWYRLHANGTSPNELMENDIRVFQDL